MKLHRALVGIVAAAVLASASAATAEPNPHGTEARCNRAVVRLTGVGQTDVEAGGTSGAAGSTEQTIGVRVPRGPLAILGAPKTVTFVGDGYRSRVHAAVSGVVVVDGRGTAAGWALSVSVSDSHLNHVVACVTRVDLTARSTHGLTVKPARRGRAELLRAAPGTGDGAYSVSFSLTADADARSAEPIVAGLRFDISPPDRRVSSAGAG